MFKYLALPLLAAVLAHAAVQDNWEERLKENQEPALEDFDSAVPSDLSDTPEVNNKKFVFYELIMPDVSPNIYTSEKTGRVPLRKTVVDIVNPLSNKPSLLTFYIPTKYLEKISPGGHQYTYFLRLGNNVRVHRVNMTTKRVNHLAYDSAGAHLKLRIPTSVFLPKTIFPLETNSRCQAHLASGPMFLYIPRSNFEEPFRVHCSKKNYDKRSWLLIYRQEDEHVKKITDWNAYKQGYGTLHKGAETNNYFIGLQKLHVLTKRHEHTLLIEYNRPHPFYSTYDHFVIGSESKGYPILSLGQFQGAWEAPNMTELLHKKFITDTPKFTHNRDVQLSCEVFLLGGWWDSGRPCTSDFFAYRTVRFYIAPNIYSNRTTETVAQYRIRKLKQLKAKLLNAKKQNNPDRSYTQALRKKYGETRNISLLLSPKHQHTRKAKN